MELLLLLLLLVMEHTTGTTGRVGGSCEHGNKLSGSIKYWKILEYFDGKAASQ
jgi:hypothetical protein